MRIGITTWHSGANAGTFFQVYGLYKYLESRGHHVEIIDYQHNKKDYISRGLNYYVSQPFALIKRHFLRKHNSKKITLIENNYKQEISLRNQRFKEMYSLMNITKPIKTDNDFEELNNQFDIFIVGSDQIWNATMLNRRYFLDYVKNGKIKAAYCPSIGSGSIFKHQKLVFQKYLKSFNYIATREIKLKQILSPLLPIKIEHLLDPSMLYSKDEYLKLAHLPKGIEAGKYLLCYFMPQNKFQADQAKKFANERGLKLLIMTMQAYSYTIDDAELYISTGPKEFIGLIANAGIVFTSSFHCVLFSIMFHKDLYVFEQNFSSKTANTNLRYIEQLETYGITHRYIKWKNRITDENLRPIDYNKVENIFQERLKESKNFINQFC